MLLFANFQAETEISLLKQEKFRLQAQVSAPKSLYSVRPYYIFITL